MIDSSKYNEIASLLAHLSNAFHDLANETENMNNEICEISDRLGATIYETVKTKQCLKDIGDIISKMG